MTTDFLGPQRRARFATRALLLVFCAYTVAAGVAYVWITQTLLGSVSHVLDATGWGREIPWLVGGALVAVMAWRAARTYALLSNPERVFSEAGALPVPLAPRDPLLQTLRNVVEEVCVSASMPVPGLWVLPRQAGINAMAAGTGSRQGLLFTDEAARALRRDELQAVAAHEVAHLASGDARLNTLLAALTAGASAGFAPLAWVTKRAMRLVAGAMEELIDGLSTSSSSVRDVFTTVFLGLGIAILMPLSIEAFMGMAATPWFALFTFLSLMLVPLAGIGGIGHVLGTTVSAQVARHREHHADALAVELTRHPEAYVRAIGAVEAQPVKGYIITSERARLNHFFFARPTIDPPLLDATVPHPPLATRAARILGAGFAPLAPEATSVAPEADETVWISHAAPTSPLAALPAPLLDACHDAARAPLAVLAVLIREGETPEIDCRRVLNASGFDPEAVLALVEQTEPGADLLPAIEVAMPALRELGGAARQRLAASTRAIIAADGRHTLAEYAVGQMLRWGLAAPPSGTVTPTDIAHASDLLFAAIADAGSPLAGARAQAVQAGRMVLRAALAVPAAPEAIPERPFTHLDRALDVLRRASSVQRHAILDAARAVVEADGLTRRQEAALLRAAALALGVACVVHPEPLAHSGPLAPRHRAPSASPEAPLFSQPLAR